MNTPLLVNKRTGKYTILNGDILTHIPEFNNGQFKLIITSPPYNIGKQYEKRVDLQEYLNWQKTKHRLIVKSF